MDECNGKQTGELTNESGSKNELAKDESEKYVEDKSDTNSEAGVSESSNGASDDVKNLLKVKNESESTKKKKPTRNVITRADKNVPLPTKVSNNEKASSDDDIKEKKRRIKRVNETENTEDHNRKVHKPLYFKMGIDTEELISSIQTLNTEDFHKVDKPGINESSATNSEYTSKKLKEVSEYLLLSGDHIFTVTKELCGNKKAKKGNGTRKNTFWASNCCNDKEVDSQNLISMKGTNINNSTEVTRNRLEITAATKLEQANLKQCDFCSSKSCFICQTCVYRYCETCVSTLHPAIGPFKQHNVLPIALATEQKRCALHGLGAKMLCKVCQEHRCIECANTTCALHFQTTVDAVDVTKEKQRLLHELDSTRQVLKSLQDYKHRCCMDVEDVQLKAMMRKDEIRQEFVSFYELLTESENGILAELEEVVTERKNTMKDLLDESFPLLETKGAELMTSITTVIETPTEDVEFTKEAFAIQRLCKSFRKKIEHFRTTHIHSWKFSKDSILEDNFSLYFEKQQLFRQFKAVKNYPVVTFKQKTLFLNQSDILKISDHVETISVLPPSTSAMFTITLLKGLRTVLWSGRTHDLKSVFLNFYDIMTGFWGGRSYILKVETTLLRQVGARRLTCMKSTASHMMIFFNDFRYTNQNETADIWVKKIYISEDADDSKSCTDDSESYTDDSESP